MAFLHSLPAPSVLEVNDSNVAEKRSEWKETVGPLQRRFKSQQRIKEMFK